MKNCLDILCNTSNEKCWTEKVKYYMKIFYLIEFLVFDARVTKILLKPTNNFPTSRQKRF